ncbi:MAG: tetratricopeptide repeat protein [Thermodesulfobacteriota bacterium]
MPTILKITAPVFFLFVCACSGHMPESDAWRLMQVEKGLHVLQQKQKTQAKKLEVLERDLAALDKDSPEELMEKELYEDQDGFVKGPRPNQEPAQIFYDPPADAEKKAGPAEKEQDQFQEKRPPRAAVTKPDTEKNESPPKENFEQAYKKALEMLWDDKPGPAREKFLRLQKIEPDNELQPNVQYWIGETYYDQQRFAQAILNFKQVVQNYPRSAKAPDALLKVSLCYEKLGDEQNSNFYKRILREDYPDSEAVSKLK